MHGMVQSQSFNGDGKMLHYPVEWKDRMHIGFHVFGNQVPGLHKRVLHYFEFLTNIDEEKKIYTRWVGPSPTENSCAISKICLQCKIFLNFSSNISGE